MDTNSINGVLRAIVPALIAWLVGAGKLPAGDYGWVLAGLSAIIAAVWSVKTNLPAK